MCGVIGIIENTQLLGPSTTQSANEVYRGLLTLQHRGQDAAGIMSYQKEENAFHCHKNLGLVAKVFDQETMDQLKGHVSIGHNRYATIGADDISALQPMRSEFNNQIAMAHNGNVFNYYKLKESLKSDFDLDLKTSNDLEAILSLWTSSFEGEPSKLTSSEFFQRSLKASRTVFKKAIGSYSVVGMAKDQGLFAFRDPSGLRPLVLGKKVVKDETSGELKKSYCIASETKAFDFLNYDYVRDIQAGELLFINEEGEIFSEVCNDQVERVAHCMFEWIYFAGAESTIENRSVYSSRLGLGYILANKMKDLIDSGEINPDIIVPIPDTSCPSAIAISETLNKPYREVLIRNRYVQRSFIQNSDSSRENTLKIKFSPVKSQIEGKRIMLVDDSIVRGVTAKRIVSLLKNNGAKEIYFVSTCPPIRFPCYYGIDFPSPNELVAHKRELEQIEEYFGVKKIVYLEVDDVKEALGTDELCLACLNGDYPTSIADGEEFAKNRRLES